MTEKEKKKRNSSAVKKLAYTLAGFTVAGTLAAAVTANIGFMDEEFDPSKYSNKQSQKDDSLVFDGVAYSGSKTRNNSDEKRKSSKKEDESNMDEPGLKPQNDAVYGGEMSVAELVRSGDENAEQIGRDSILENDRGTAGTLPIISGVGSLDVRVPDTNGAQGSENTGNTGGSGRPSGGNGSNAPSIRPTDKPNKGGGSNSGTNTDKPNSGDTNNDNTNGGGNGGGGNSGGESEPTAPLNPSKSDVQAPSRDDSGGNGGGSSSSGGHSGIYSGKPIEIAFDGDFSDLCVGQSLESIFSEKFGREIYLKFTKGEMMLKSASVSVSGLEISGLSTSRAVENAVAKVSFLYETTKYEIEIPYSVKAWKAQLYMPDGTAFPMQFTPDSSLKLSLDRYYTAFKTRYPKFIGWRCEGSDEIYTTECFMFKPSMDLYACLEADAPEDEVVGEEYTLEGITDVDISSFGVYTKCKKLIISADVRSISMEGIAEKFPSLEEIEVSPQNPIYTAVDGILYKDGTMVAVPPKKTEIAEFAEGVEKIGSFAFENSEIKNLVLPETVKYLDDYAFFGAAFDSLTITAERYSVGNRAFYSENNAPAAAEIVSKSLYVPSLEPEAANFGNSMPKITVPDSMYDRVYQYCLADWGYMAEEFHGEGTATDIFKTETGAETRNTLIGGGVYSFFGKEDEYTLTAVVTNTKDEFKVDSNTVDVADNAFVGCGTITSLVFGDKLAKINSAAMNGLDNLKSITFSGKPPKIDSSFFENVDAEQFKIYVPAEKYDDYYYAWADTIDDLFGEGSAYVMIDMNLGSFEIIRGARYVRDERGLVLLRVTEGTDKDYEVEYGTYKIAEAAFETQLDSVIIPDTVVELPSRPARSRINIGSLFVNSTVDLGNVNFGASRVFVPKSAAGSCSYAYAVADKYEYSADKTVLAEGSLLYVPKSYTGTLTLAEDTIEIFDGAANGCLLLEQVKTDGALLRIGEYAFRNCQSLIEIEFGTDNEMHDVGCGAFENCSALESIVFPKTLTELSNGIFYNCDRLASVMAEGAEKIGSQAFMRCNALQSFNGSGYVNLGGNIAEVGEGAFSYCPRIESIDFSMNMNELKESVFENCVSLSEVKNWGGINTIGTNSFRNTGFYTVSLPDNKDTVVRSGAFADCANIDNIIVKNGVRSIAADFAEDGAGVILVLDGIVSSLEADTMAEMAQNGVICDTVYYTEDMEKAEAMAVPKIAKIEGAVIVSKTSGGVYAMEKSGSVTIMRVGRKCRVFDMINGKNVEYIADDAFSDCIDIEEVYLGRAIYKIPDYIFEGREKLRVFEIISKEILTHIEKMEIGDGVFKNCTALETITLARSITSLGRGVFEGCTGLKYVNCGGVIESLPDDTFNGCTNLTVFNILINSLQNIKHIGARSFKDCVRLESISGLGGGGLLFAKLESIDENAFENCSSLMTISIPQTVQRINGHAFEGCDSLERIEILGEPFEIGEFVLGSTADSKYFSLDEISDEKYAEFEDMWRGRLENDYGEGAFEKLAVRAADEETDFNQETEKNDGSEDDVPVRSDKAAADNGTSENENGTAADGGKESDEQIKDGEAIVPPENENSDGKITDIELPDDEISDSENSADDAADENASDENSEEKENSSADESNSNSGERYENEDDKNTAEETSKTETSGGTDGADEN